MLPNILFGFQSFGIERTWWRLSQKVRNVFILLLFYVIIWLGKIYTGVITVWLIIKKYLYLKLLRRSVSFLYHRQDILLNLTVYRSTTAGFL